MIIAGVAYFLSGIGDIRIIDYVLLFSFTITGIGNMTNDFGASKTYFKISDNKLILKLQNRLKARFIEDSDINSISLQKTRIIINHRTEKPCVIKLKPFSINQRNQIYNFIIDYSKDRKIITERSLT